MGALQVFPWDVKISPPRAGGYALQDFATSFFKPLETLLAGKITMSNYAQLASLAQVEKEWFEFGGAIPTIVEFT